MITRLGVAALATMATLGALLATNPAQSSAPSGDCAVPLPVAEVAAGDPVTGLTVSRGTVPTPFTGEVLGVVTGGIAPDLDLVMVRLTSPEIDRVGGIWQGMSGSPVYAADGRLIGAVAYGLAYGTSPVAGVTPFEYMDDYAAAPTRVRIGDPMAHRIAAATDLTAAQASQGFEELPLPGGVSGVRPARLTKTRGRPYLDRQVASWGTSSTAAGPETIVAGGNLAMTAAYGDITMGAVGTATSVCDDTVVGFGHPVTFVGELAAAMHPADAVYVQEDPLGVPFKVANLGDVAGTVTDDHLAGITGTLGPLPATVDVSSTLRYEGLSRTGVSHVSIPSELAGVTFYQIVGNHDRVMDKYGPGTEDNAWTITGRRPTGTPFTLEMGQQYVSSADITYTAAWDVPDLVWLLGELPGVQVDSVTASARVSDDDSVWKLTGVQRRSGGTWTRLDPGATLRVRAGTTLRLRALLTGEAGSRTLLIPIELPAGLSGTTGKVRLYGGEGEFSAWMLEEAESLPEFLAIARRAIRADQVAVWVEALDDRSSVYGETLTSKPIDKVVRTGAVDQSFELVIR